MHPKFLSNTYLVAAREGEEAFFVDAGGPVEPLVEAAQRLRLRPSHVLLTHHHFDHVSDLDVMREQWPSIRALIQPLEREQMGEAGAALAEIDAGRVLRIGGLEVRPLHTPGHTAGMLSFLVSHPVPAAPTQSAVPGGFTGTGGMVFTGDTLFKGSVGGVHAPGHTTYIDLRDSIMGTLMELPPDTVIHPGHADASTVAQEWETNRFIRIWRGKEPEGERLCTALGEPARLILLGDDYDGGHKAWVRWRDGRDDIVPGSQVRVS